MAAIKVGIVEDEMIIAEGIAMALEQLGYHATEPVTNYTDALEMIASERPDILLLDIQLSGKKDGIDLAWKIREDYNIPFIFLTANSDPATVDRAKKLNPPAYLVKPFNKEDLYTSIEICLHNYAANSEKEKTAESGNYIIKESLFIKQGSAFTKVKIDDITYIESDNVYVNIFTLTNKLLVRSTIPAYLDIINVKHFVRVHRSFAVNAHHIDSITANSVLVQGREIPIGKVYRDELLVQLRLG
jgi:two-component system response regulator LytT